MKSIVANRRAQGGAEPETPTAQPPPPLGVTCNTYAGEKTQLPTNPANRLGNPTPLTQQSFPNTAYKTSMHHHSARRTLDPPCRVDDTSAYAHENKTDIIYIL